MTVTAIKTHKITKDDTDIFAILDKYILALHEKSVVAITSKIVSITEGRIVKVEDVENVEKGRTQKDMLIEQESEYYLPRNDNKYGVSFAIAHGVLAASAGIDESNGNGAYVLWPSNPQKSANDIRSHLISRCDLNNLGVIITDSKTTPLRWGVTGFALAYSGFSPLKDYIGTPDIFGRKLVYEKMNIADGLAASASVVMGEGSEQTPLAVLTDLADLHFKDTNPTDKELKSLKINMDEDLYAPLLKKASWLKGKSPKKT